jgi:hypothetical protein
MDIMVERSTISGWRTSAMTHTFLAVAGKLVSVGLILLTPVIAVLLAALLWAVGLARGWPAIRAVELGARAAGHATLWLVRLWLGVLRAPLA